MTNARVAKLEDAPVESRCGMVGEPGRPGPTVNHVQVQVLPCAPSQVDDNMIVGHDLITGCATRHTPKVRA